MLGHVNYLCAPDVASANPEFTNVVNNVPQISVKDIIYGNSMTEKGNSRRRILRPEHNSFALMKDLLRMYLKPGSLVVDAFVQTISAAKAFLLLE